MYFFEQEDFLSHKECEEIMLERASQVSERYEDFCFWRWHGLSKSSETLDTLEAKMLPKVESYLSNFNSLLSMKDIKLAGFGIIKQAPNVFDNLHYDSPLFNQENIARLRPFVCLIYLNDNFTGGELVFPVQKKVIAAKQGKLVLFPASYMFPHQVLPISDGNRCFIRLNYFCSQNISDRNLDNWNVEKDGIQKFD